MKTWSSTAIFRVLLFAVVMVFASGALAPARQVAAADAASPITGANMQAQTEGLHMNATPASSGYFKYGEWLPVLVELENQGSDLDAQVRVQVSGSQGSLVFETPVALPSGSRKLVTVYVLPNNFSRELEVVLVSKGKALASKKVSVHPEPNISYFAGLVAPERGALALLNGVKFTGQERPKILTDLSLSDLPNRVEGLRSFNLLIFNDIDTSSITPEQASALVSWVQQGGRLVIGGGPGAQRTLAGIPEALQPAHIQGTVEVGKDEVKALADFVSTNPIVADGPFVAARGEPINSAVLVGDNNLPQVVQRTLGSGTSVFVAFDLAGIPFNGWPGTQAFWQALIGPSGSYTENLPFDVSPRQFRANSLTYPLSNIPSLDLPSVQNVSILLIIYILIVGPANYLVLRWRKRMHWAWITIPVITILFTAGAFLIGYGMRGTDLILNKIAVVELKPDGNASLTSYMGLFSPRMQSYEIDIQGEGLVSPMTGYDSNPWGASVGGAPTGGEMVLVQGQPAKVKGLTVNQWAMQSFMSEGTWQNFGQITGDLQIQNETLIGKVRNNTAHTITDAVVAMQSRFTRLGDFAPGQEKEINLALSSLQSDRFGPPLSYRLYQEQFTSGPMPRALEQKSNIVSNIFENGMYGKFSSSMPVNTQGTATQGNVLFFGWLDQAPPNVSVTNSTLTQKTTALVYTTLDYSTPDTGMFVIPAGLIPGGLTKVPFDGGTCGIGTSVHMSKGQAEFEFAIPGNLQNLRIDTLKLAIGRDSGNPGAIPTFGLYNWKQESWVIVQDPIQGVNVIQNATPYVSDTGVVRVQMTSESDTFGCIYLDLGLEGTRQTGAGG